MLRVENFSSRSIVAVVVTYKPELKALRRLLDTLVPQVESVVIVDNGSSDNLAALGKQGSATAVEVLCLGENRGIATAQNVGIQWARDRGAEFVLLMDQDSAPPSDLVVKLQFALADLEKAGEKVAAVGPRFVDSRWGENKTRSPFSRFKNGRMVGCYPPDGSSYVAVDFLIASGSLISMKAFDAIGGMIEELFIDYVDIEWGVRARQMRWSLYGIWDIVMKHDLGDDCVVVLGHSIPVHSPLRHYYAIRNAAWLCCRVGLRRKWKFCLAYNGFRRFIAYSLFMPQPFKHFRFMCLGLWHGLHGKAGKFAGGEF